MSRLRAYWLASAALLAAAPAAAQTPPTQSGPASAPTAQSATTSGAGAPSVSSEANEREAYLRTERWSFPGAEGVYRLLTANVTGRERSIAAQVGLAITQANQGRGAEARATLARAEALAGELGGGADLLALVTLGRAIEAGQDATRSSGAARREAFERSIVFSRQAAAQLASGASGGGAAGKVEVDATGAVVIDAFDAALYNDILLRRDRGGLSRPLEPGERAAIRIAHARHLEAAGLAGLDRFDEAEAANAAAEAALAGAPARTANWLRGQIPAHRAEVALRRRDPQAAQRLYEEAVRRVRVTPLNGSRLEAALLKGLARAQLARGDRAGAEQSLRNSVEVLSQQSDGLQIPREEVEDYLALLAVGAVAGDQAKLAEYVRVSSIAVELDTARTMALVAAEFAAGEGPEAEAIRRYQQTEQAWRRARARNQAVSQSDSGATPEEKRFAEAQENETFAAYEAARTAAAALGNRVQAVLSEPVTLADVQKTLKPDEAYVRYLFVKGRLQAWVARPDGASLHDLDINEDEVGEEVELIRRAFVRFFEDEEGRPLAEPRVAPFSIPRNERLYGRIVRPLEAGLGGARQVNIEPTGALFSLPFASLVAAPLSEEVERRRATNRGDFRGVEWFGKRRALALSPGTGAFIRLRSTPASTAARPLLAFADPEPVVGPGAPDAQLLSLRRTVIDPTSLRDPAVCIEQDKYILAFTRLQETADEVRQVAATLGADPSQAIVQKAAFTDSAIMKRTDLREYKVVYFATHGMLPQGLSCWPHPVLATSFPSEAGGDGMLDAVEIGRLRLNADLVVLSACDTAGAGSEGGPGAGQALGGLAQSFALAGSRGLLVSHWPVDSAATTQLMTELFKERAGGASTARALIDSQGKLRDELKTSHPYYWAAFTLVGEG